MPKRKRKSKSILSPEERYKIIVPATVAILVAVIGGVCGMLSPILLKYYEFSLAIPTQTATANKEVPTPESFTPLFEFSPEDIGLVHGPIPGIYISKGSISQNITSWSAILSSNRKVPAESKICLMNKGFPPPERRPLNLSAHSISLNVSIYLEAKGKLTITGYELIVEFSPNDEKIQSLEILTGGAGGGSFNPFGVLVMPEMMLSSPNQTSYVQEMDWLDLKTGEGVTLSIPLELAEDGQYSFQFKAALIFTSTDPNVQSRHLSLTTGQDTYSWFRIDDPRSYKITAGEYPIDLVKCP